VDAKDEDLIDETRLYYPVSDVRLFPIHPLAVADEGVHVLGRGDPPEV
jgi:hypothetical protein